MTKGIKKLLGRRPLFLMALGYSILITVAFLYPRVGPTISSNFPWDKVVHVTLHAMLIFVWLHYYFSFRHTHKILFVIAMFLGLCVFYGIIIEILQESLTTSRSGDFKDLIANSIGIAIGALLVFLMKAQFIKLKSKL